jgi:hypothetical protein
MTTAAITAQLPNGFHDGAPASCTSTTPRNEVHFEFDFLFGMPDAETEEGREAMRSGVLRLTGVTSMRISPPDSRYKFATARRIRVDGDFGVYPATPRRPKMASCGSGSSSRRGTAG